MSYEDVPNKIDFSALERDIHTFWERHGCFEKLREKNRGGPKWSFLDGPITANNPMGVHHAWGRAYKDVFQRYHAMLGHEQRYQNGFDCQGLWVEVEVEKELGFKSKRDIEQYGIARFVERCKERVRKYAAIQTQQSIRLGYWMDWANSYYTMSDVNNYTIWAFLRKCHDRGFVYRGRDVMPWCARCGTGLSQHEIATEGYRQLTHTSVTVCFPIEGRDKESLLVWTTTPWTLVANVAAAVHPEKTYVRIRREDSVYYIIKELAGKVKDGTPEAEIPGRDLIGLEYRGPFDELPAQAGLRHRVIPWEEVSEAEGTGVVHVAPGCGAEDFGLSKEHDLAVLAPIDESGIYLDGYGEFTGKSALEIAPRVLELLKGKGILFRREEYTHSYPVCWRCSHELVFRLVDEWYISMDQLRHEITDVTGETEWIPSYGKDREFDWLANMRDWMISKKRYWGLALPIWQCKECGWFDVIGGVDELRERAVAGWAGFEGHSPHRPYIDAVQIECGKCGARVSRIEDVGNPWLDAGIVPYSTLKYVEDRKYWEEWFPADLITESFPGQFRNWFYAILAMSTVMEHRAPFKLLFGYALMRDETGREMHKSWGNAIEFNQAAEKAGVDATRWLFASHNPEQNLNFGYGPIDDARRRFLVLWNVYSFFVTYANVDEFQPRSERLPVEERAEMDRWILSNLQRLTAQARKNFEECSIHLLMKEVERFVDQLSTWYVRRGRRRFWRSQQDEDKRAAYETLYEVLTTLVRLLAPIIPFATEAIYQNLVRSHDAESPESVHLTAFPQVDESLIDPELNETMDLVLQVVELGRAARQKANLKVRQPLSVMRVKLARPALRERLDPFKNEILDELNVKQIELHDTLADLVDWHIDLDARKLGPKLGGRFQEVLRGVKSMPARDVAAQVSAGEGLRLPTSSGFVAVDPADVRVTIVGGEGWSVAENGGTQVALSTTLTEELRLEGAVRDLVRHVQMLRKEAGFDVSDRIILELEAPGGGMLERAVEVERNYLTSETLARDLKLGRPTSPHHKSVKVAGENVVLGVIRV